MGGTEPALAQQVAHVDSHLRIAGGDSTGLVRLLVHLACFASISACAFVEFELGPFAARDIEIVYSEQEDLSFISWRLPGDVELSELGFSLRLNGRFEAVDLGSAPFAAEPYECDGELCFQYQVPGLYEPTEPPLRTLHRLSGYYASQPANFRHAATTVDFEPRVVERNASVELRIVDWFARNAVPLKRDFEWRYENNCARERADFEPAMREVALPAGWEDDWTADSSKCVQLRPDRADMPGAVVASVIEPIAETLLLEEQNDTPPSIQHATLFGVLFDLAVADPERCDQLKQHFVSEMLSTIQGRDRNAQLIGAFEPVDSEQCRGALPRAYPVGAMVAAAFDAGVASEASAKTVLWVYVSNRRVASPAFAEAAQSLMLLTAELEPAPAYAWAIVPLDSVGTESLDVRIDYRSVEDPALSEDISGLVRATVPFTTLDFDVDSYVEINLPERGQWVRICQSVPLISRARHDDLEIALVPGHTYPFPESKLEISVDLEPQFGVPASEYLPPTVRSRSEICTRFCEQGVPTADGAFLSNWLTANECAGHS